MLSRQQAEFLECLIANGRNLKIARIYHGYNISKSEAERLLRMYDSRELVSYRSNGLFRNREIIDEYISKNLSINIKNE